MLARVLAASLGLSAALGAAACQTSSRYATPANAAIGTGIAVGAAAVNRAVTGECWASCRPGTVCDRATGLCVEPGHRSNPRTGSSSGPGAPAVMTGEPYPPGHEYEVPSIRAGAAAAGVDAGCVSSASSAASEDADGGALFCQMDGGGS
jgi:hypothetical protein